MLYLAGSKDTTEHYISSSELEFCLVTYVRSYVRIHYFDLLYKAEKPSVRLSVCLSVCLSVRTFWAV